MALKYAPAVGEVVVCAYGAFKELPDGTKDANNIDGRVPPEMVKRRLVVVLNGRINNACIVVPLSATFDRDKTTKRWHIEVNKELIKNVRGFTTKDRWAKADHVQQVSRDRLSSLGKAVHLPRDVVASIQRAVARTIGAASLLAAETPKAAPGTPPEPGAAAPDTGLPKAA